MYRIELSPGEETVFRSIEELAVAIKRGVVSPRARIYHNSSNKWLPIQFHPHYKTALSMPLSQSASSPGRRRNRCPHSAWMQYQRSCLYHRCPSR